MKPTRAKQPPPDQDGKSQTASAVDVASYPEQNQQPPEPEEVLAPTHEEIAEHARRLWESRGRPEGTAEIDWRRAEEELRSQREDLRKNRKETGSVQR